MPIDLKQSYVRELCAERLVNGDWMRVEQGGRRAGKTHALALEVARHLKAGRRGFGQYGEIVAVPGWTARTDPRAR